MVVPLGEGQSLEPRDLMPQGVVPRAGSPDVRRTSERPTGTIDFVSPMPYYVQLMQLLRLKIDNGDWPVGAQLPGEPELCNLYGISRTVVRQALGEMEQQNLVVRRKGKGTYVAAPKVSESLAQKLTGFYQDMTERGYRIATEVLHQRVVPASEKVAGYLQVARDTKVVDICRLRFVNDEPIQLVTTYLPYDLCPAVAEVDLRDCSLYDFLESTCGLVLARGRRYIEAVAANEVEARLLQIERGAPLVLLDSVSFLEDGQPVEYYHAVHRGDRSRFEIELVRVREHGRGPARPSNVEPVVESLASGLSENTVTLGFK